MLNMLRRVCNISALNSSKYVRFASTININGIEGYVNFEPGYSSQKYGNDIISYDKDNLIFNDYNEKLYLDKNPDISEMINKKIISSGLVHYKNLGEKEKLIRNLIH